MKKIYIYLFEAINFESNFLSSFSARCSIVARQTDKITIVGLYDIFQWKLIFLHEKEKKKRIISDNNQWFISVTNNEKEGG